MEKLQNFVLILSGCLGAGKSTAAKYISKNYDYRHLSFVREIWEPILKQRSLKITRSNLQELGIELMENIGPKGIVELLINMILPSEKIVIDDVRRDDVVEIIKTYCSNTFLVFIDLDFENRYPRLVKRDNVKSIEEQRKAESIETETTIPNLKLIANKVITNSGDLNSFYIALDQLVIEMENKFTIENG